MTREEAARVLEEIWKRYASKVDDIVEEEVDAIFAAIAALRGPQPDPDTGLVPCEYCSGNHETQEVMPSDPDTIWTIMPDRKQLSFINCNWGCNDYVVDINYCPMCGRKLEGV